MIKYLLSDIDWEVGIEDALRKELQKDIKSARKIILFPTEYKNLKKTNKYLNYIMKSFIDININFKEVVLITSDMTSIDITTHIETSDVIFLMGGDTIQQMNFIKDKSLVQPLRNFNGVMIGMSAGALNMCKRGVLLDEHPTENIHFYEGLGVVDIAIEVHYDKSNDYQNELVKKSLNTLGQVYCINDNGFIIIKDKIETIGEVHLAKSTLPVIETNRLLLRHWMESDLDDLYEYAKCESVGPSAGWPAHKSIDGSKHVLNRFLTSNTELAVVLKSENKVIGGIGVHFRYPDDNLLLLNQREIGYVLNPMYWGNGYIPEAVEGIKEYVFRDVGVDLLWCGHYDFNKNSKRVHEKCGFKYQFTDQKTLTKLSNKKVNVLYYNIKKEFFI